MADHGPAHLGPRPDDHWRSDSGSVRQSHPQSSCSIGALISTPQSQALFINARLSSARQSAPAKKVWASLGRLAPSSVRLTPTTGARDASVDAQQASDGGVSVRGVQQWIGQVGGARRTRTGRQTRLAV
ncbi:hypothetical protein PSHT_07614 [Puccinia striiformis]|uniref:Uncharacterized protein n=3 Tax=Puccinia striiformis TaxID=27350 RepID=A0A0L0VUJ0_9BASI|nr:hypothetical protein H4Q26_009995 [Puccinia striiformis f. sp. tritici PST-130]KAI9623027.1 hypothetical protein KEM48_009644 [Puccinia striiformis f. sp. tritici PST-130]KNF02655.1 hypothetical protein PSTG_04252 [Puccinia striiformis f. sp. tritici PST-78]POV98838.1 hypothetical protein PSTT_14154 [Puccinia striiformis]POW13706.1 hypothetical protein PSHT_07614 [Puccinia striiformis]